MENNLFDDLRRSAIGTLELRHLSEDTREYLTSSYFRGYDKIDWLFGCQAGLRYIAAGMSGVPHDDEDLELIRGMFIDCEFYAADAPSQYSLQLFHDDSLFIDHIEFDAYARVSADYRDILRDWRRGLGRNASGFPKLMQELDAYVKTTNRAPDYRLPDEP